MPNSAGFGFTLPSETTLAARYPQSAAFEVWNEPNRGYFFRSDHFPLAKIGIPAVSISDPVEYIAVVIKRIIGVKAEVRDGHQPGRLDLG